MPTSALHELARLNIQYPMTFMISNSQMGMKSFCGVLEFSAEEGMVHIPVWMMNNLCLEEGSEIILRNMNLQKGTFIKIAPHETAFIDLANPKAILEQELTHYSVLHKGDTISIQYGGRDYLIDIVETKPDDQICCVETNIEVDFAPPKDYVEPAPVKKQASVERKKKQEEEDAALIEEIKRIHKRIDGKPLTEKMIREHLKKRKEQKQQENPSFDPRKNRLKHGIRNYREAGEAKHEIGAFAGTGMRIG